MKVYIVMRDGWFEIGNSNDRAWIRCDNMGVFDSLDKASDFIDNELDRLKLYDYTEDNFSNYMGFMEVVNSDIYEDIQDALERHYYSRYADIRIISLDLLKQPISDTHIYYIIPKEVQ